VCPCAKRPLDRVRQEKPADAHSHELAEQSKVGDLNGFFGLPFEFDLARYHSVQMSDPYLDLRPFEVSQPSGV